jgi:hypothetical protein
MGHAPAPDGPDSQGPDSQVSDSALPTSAVGGMRWSRRQELQWGLLSAGGGSCPGGLAERPGQRGLYGDVLLVNGVPWPRLGAPGA